MTAERASVVAIDEAQFFDDGLPEVAELLAAEGRTVLVSGLDQDFLGGPSTPCRHCWRWLTRSPS